MKRKNNDLFNNIIELIQASLVGKLKTEVNFNPQFLANAILDKVEFEENLIEKTSKNVSTIKNEFLKMINDVDVDMDEELKKLNKEELMLRNFIFGQKEACEKLNESLNNLKL